MSIGITSQDFDHCLDLLKTDAPDFYLADLLLPTEHQAAIVVLHAFHVEVTNICLAGGEPMAGQMRLQWWAEVVNGTRDDEASGHPVARALLQVIGAHNLPTGSFEAKLEAHIFDLYQDPMGSRTDFEAYCGETRSCLFQWAALISGVDADRSLADASGHSGVATGVVNIQENMARHQNAGQVYVPSELLAAVGMTRETFLTEAGSDHEAVVLGLIDLAGEHLSKAQAAVDNLPLAARSVFKPLALVPVYLKQARRSPLSLFKPRPALSQLRKQWALWRF